MSHTENSHDRNASEGCGCCVTPGEANFEYTCEDKQAVFTPRETDVLSRIHQLAMRARELKQSMADGSGGTEAREELDRLREERAELEKERLEARDERMRLLGYDV
jgi:hypothetical protein